MNVTRGPWAPRPPEDPLRPTRGILNGILLGAVVWIVVLLVLFGTSVWGNLGRQAVESGVIQP